MARSRKVNQKLENKLNRYSQDIGHVVTPHGVAVIVELVESRGYTTNYMPKQFRYVRIPDCGYAPLTKYTIDHWKSENWEIVMYHDNSL